MAEDIKEASEVEVSPPSGKAKPNIIMIAVIAVAVGAAGFFAGKLLTSKGNGEDKQAQQQEAVENGGEKQAAENGQKEGGEQQTVEQKSEEALPGIMKLDEFTVNLNDPFGKRYANLTINLELKDKALLEKIMANELLMPKIRDTIFMILSAKTFNDLNSLAGKENLKDEIKIRLNKILQQHLEEPEIVKEIYFDKFLLQ